MNQPFEPRPLRPAFLQPNRRQLVAERMGSHFDRFMAAYIRGGLVLLSSLTYFAFVRWLWGLTH